MSAARARLPVVLGVKTPEALVALGAWLDALDSRTRRRGEDYYDHGQVEEVWAEADHFVEAVVIGGERYAVTLFLTRGKWTSKCSCPVQTNCKHACAAGLAWIATVNAGDKVVGPPDADLPAPPLFAPRPTPAPKKSSFLAQWAPVIAEKLGRPLTTAENRRIGSLAAVFAEFTRVHRTLYPDTLLRHGFEYSAAPDAPLYAPAFPGWWDRDTAPADPWALWQFIAYDYELAGRPIPEVFRPLTDTAAVHAAISAGLVQKELATWRAALAPLGESGVSGCDNPATCPGLTPMIFTRSDCRIVAGPAAGPGGCAPKHHRV